MSDEDHARFADWDGAYVLGALTPSDRHAYEEHLETCSRCRAAVAELAPMPGLLAQIRPTEEGPAEERRTEEGLTGTGAAAQAPDLGATTTDQPGPVRVDPAPPEDAAVVPPALHEIRGTRPPGRRRVLVGLLAAAAALVLAIALPLALGERGADEVVTVSPVAAGEAAAPMRVDVDLSPRAWGTALTIRCDYPSAQPAGSDGYGGYGRYGGGAAPPSYALVVTAADGTRSEVSSWQGVPGEVVTLEAATAVDLADITEISVVDPAGAVVLRAEVDAV